MEEKECSPQRREERKEKVGQDNRINAEVKGNKIVAVPIFHI